MKMELKSGVYCRIELELKSDRAYRFPFIDVEAYCRFESPTGKSYTAMFFYRGINSWTCRFMPNEAGEWSYHTCSINGEACFATSGRIVVETGKGNPGGMLQTNRTSGWGLGFESGEEALLLGDTLYHLFGAEYCGLNVREILERRKRQGFNFIRVRLPVSLYHPGDIHNVWQNRPIWLWGGSPQCPEYESFNLEYFDAVDRVMILLEELDMGAELIFEGWMWEIPFNDRQNFLPEFEELYIRYAIARLSSYRSLYIWCPANEYNYYGQFSNRAWCWRLDHPSIKYLASKFMLRFSRIIQAADPHKHPIGVHNVVTKEPFQDYFINNPEIEVLLYQFWGDLSSKKAVQLASGLEDDLKRNILGSGKVNILAEYGYEGDPASGLSKPPHDEILSGHTRRGAYKALFMGMHFVAGFENTWGPHFCAEPDPRGASEIIHMKKLFTETLRFSEFAPDFERVADGSKAKEAGDKDSNNLCLSNQGQDTFVVYLPVGGEACLNIPCEDIKAVWLFDTSSGEMKETKEYKALDGKTAVAAPAGVDADGYAKDWVIIIYQ